MKFYITRTGDDYRSGKPCDNAVEEFFESTQWYWIKDENGKSMKQFVPCMKKRWAIEINSLEELVALCEKVKCGVIVFPGRQEKESNGVPELEIYDAYRE